MQNQLKKAVQLATVDIIHAGGRGILIPGELILTAAHCIKYNTDSSMTLGFHHSELIKTRNGELRVKPVCVELISDFALLGAHDDQEEYSAASDFLYFCDRTKPIKVFQGNIDPFIEIPVHIFNHHEQWVEGFIISTQQNPTKLFLETSEAIEPGTSGSPVINDKGELLGIVSIASMNPNHEGDYSASIPFLVNVLPKWALVP